AVVERADDAAACIQSVGAQRLEHGGFVRHADLEQRAQLLGEQRGERIGFGWQLDVEADLAGEGHLRGARENAAVGAIVIREDAAFAAELLDRVPETFEVFGAIDVWRRLAGLANGLREAGAAEAVLAAA